MAARGEGSGGEGRDGRARARRARGARGAREGGGRAGEGRARLGTLPWSRSARPQGRARVWFPRDWEGPGNCTPCPRDSREHQLLTPTRAPGHRSRARGTPGPVPPFLPFPPPTPKECRPCWKVQPRAPERQHPVPLRAGHVASQNLGVLLWQVEVMRGSSRCRERCSRRGQRTTLSKQGRDAQSVLQGF